MLNLAKSAGTVGITLKQSTNLSCHQKLYCSRNLGVESSVEVGSIKYDFIKSLFIIFEFAPNHSHPKPMEMTRDKRGCRGCFKLSDECYPEVSTLISASEKKKKKTSCPDSPDPNKATCVFLRQPSQQATCCSTLGIEKKRGNL